MSLFSRQQIVIVWVVAFVSLSLFGSLAAGDENADLDAVEAANEEPAKDTKWQSAVTSKFEMTDEQYKSLQDQGLKGNQIAMVAGLAKESGKTLDEIAKMRLEQNMGWGKIAKELGVHPGTIGQSVASVRHEIKGEHHAMKQEQRAERKESREQRRQERRAERAERKGKGKGANK
ncbi:MAG: hypothetical protein IT288_00160 [Bdellovibrionales bacterium]|nr:hypothetical protein [Bdellovibrionales bacterium]